MSEKYPVEALLRPPTELSSAVTSLSAGLIMISAPSLFMMIKPVAYAVGLACATTSFIRFNQARKILQYQRGLLRLPFYDMASVDIPVSNNYLFLGKGFKWGQEHTQRLVDTEDKEAKKYMTPSYFFRKARDFETKYDNQQWAQKIIRATKSKTNFEMWNKFNPVKPLPPVGGKPQIHAVGMLEGEKNIVMPLDERSGHTLVVGTTRVGKTRLAETLIHQDIARGDVVIVFDPKGDADLMKRMYSSAKESGRLDNFKVFHLGFPEMSVRYNPIGEYSRITEISSRISGQLPSDGNSSAFKEFAWRFTNVISRALTGLGRKSDYIQISRFITDIEDLLIDYFQFHLERLNINGWKEKIEEYRNDDNFVKRFPRHLRDRNVEALILLACVKDLKCSDSVTEGLRGAYEYEKSYFDKLTSSLLPLMEKLTSGAVGDLLAPDYANLDDNRPILDWYKVIREGGIVYVGLDALSDAEVGGAVGNSMFADLTSIAGRIYKHGFDKGLAKEDGKDVVTERRICIHADEFNELVGDEFIPMLNKAGGAGFQVTVYTQTWADVEAKMGNQKGAPKASQLEGNLNNLIMLRVKSPETIKILTEQLKETTIYQQTRMSAATDDATPGSGQEFGSQTRDQLTKIATPMLSINDIISLPKGQAFCLIEGGHLYKIRLPLPSPEDDLPKNLREMADEMEKKYVSSEEWWRVA